MMRALVMLLAAALSVPTGARADAVAVAAAAEVRPALDELVAAFRERSPSVEVSVSYGSSDALAARIASGGKVDLFFSADETAARRLADGGHAVRESLTVYAVGRLALWVPRSSPLDVAQGLAALRDARARHVAISNPAHSPSGKAAEAVLRESGTYGAVRDRLVIAEDVDRATQLAARGDADAALLPLSLALTPALSAAGRFAVVPETLHPALRQIALVTERGRRNLAATALLRHAVGPEGRAVLDRWGFGAPGR